MTKRTVFIVNPGTALYAAMFWQSTQWSVVQTIGKADLVQFTGGDDVSPFLYGQSQHPTTNANSRRDRVEVNVFHVAEKLGIPTVGICRGAQFLNVMCGGSMWQDVDNHAVSEGHDIMDEMNAEVFNGTSTHHQLMIPGPTARIICQAYETRKRSKMTKSANEVTTFPPQSQHPGDPEVIWYPGYNALCFQPHPEFTGVPKLKERYFHYIEQYLFTDLRTGT